MEESRDEQLDHAAGIVARVEVSANAEIADAVHQFEGINIGADLASLGGGGEQLSANGHEAVKEVGMQRVEANAVGLQDRSESMLRDQKINEEVDPLTECSMRRATIRQQDRTSLGTGFDLMKEDLSMNETDMAGTSVAISAPTPVISMKPVVLSAPGRGEDLHVRVSAPAVGRELPLLVFSHGFGLSLDSYDPLVDFWAAHGFVVMQPTHLDSRTLNLPPDDPRTPLIWRLRVEDMKRILDQLDLLEASVPGLSGRLDRSRIAAVGHSWGGQTASMLLGARVLEPEGGTEEDLSDSRIKAGVLLATPGQGGADLTPFAAEHFPFMHPSFEHMTTPTLVIAGDRDQSPLSVRGPDWFTDPYFLSPGSKSLLTLFGAEHSLGGIHTYNGAETTDENPERVALIQRLTWVYLRSALDPEDSSWKASRTALMESPNPLGRIESK